MKVEQQIREAIAEHYEKADIHFDAACDSMAKLVRRLSDMADKRSVDGFLATAKKGLGSVERSWDIYRQYSAQGRALREALEECDITD